MKMFRSTLMYNRLVKITFLLVIVLLLLNSISYASFEKDDIAVERVRKNLAYDKLIKDLKSQYFIDGYMSIEDESTDNKQMFSIIDDFFIIGSKDYILAYGNKYAGHVMKLFEYSEGKFVEKVDFLKEYPDQIILINDFRSRHEFNFKKDKDGDLLIFIDSLTEWADAPPEYQYIAKFKAVKGVDVKLLGMEEGGFTEYGSNGEPTNYKESPNFKSFQVEMEGKALEECPYFNMGSDILQDYEGFGPQDLNEVLTQASEKDSSFFQAVPEDTIRDLKYSLFLASSALYVNQEEVESSNLKDNVTNLSYDFIYNLINPIQDLEPNFFDGIETRPEFDSETEMMVYTYKFNQEPVRKNFKRFFGFTPDNFDHKFSEDNAVGINDENAYMVIPYYGLIYVNYATDILLRNIEDYGNHAIIKYYQVYESAAEGPGSYQSIDKYFALLEKGEVDGVERIYPVYLSRNPITKEDMVAKGLMTEDDVQEVKDAEEVEEVIEEESSEKTADKLLSITPIVLFVGLAVTIIPILAVIVSHMNKTKKLKNLKKYCSHCGAELGKDVKFCQNCGKKVN